VTYGISFEVVGTKDFVHLGVVHQVGSIYKIIQGCTVNKA
jgi:hypothetical protein